MGHNLSISTTNYIRKDYEEGYIDYALDSGEIEFKSTPDNMKEPKEVTRFWLDTITAFFLTRKAAEDYLKYQSHNLENAYIYTFYSGYQNQEMDKLFIT